MKERGKEGHHNEILISRHKQRGYGEIGRRYGLNWIGLSLGMETY